MKFGILLLLMLLGVSSVSNAQEESSSDSTDEVGLTRFWEAILTDGSFLVALDRISSISRHKYILDGALIVDEVTVDTSGQALARFYYISPLTSEGPAAIAGVVGKGIDRVTELADGKGAHLQNMVVKKYPVTTHAKSIEFRILSEKQLTDLFESAEKAWKSGKGRVFTAE
ncbi:hypothetical protein [Luteolibacter sp. AS25]|uniref:hypothetical protein n=1 Tax=Luteolibacter sp. AS25 TaxID=3135776 RepID=UPI00398A6BBD